MTPKLGSLIVPIWVAEMPVSDNAAISRSVSELGSVIKSAPDASNPNGLIPKDLHMVSHSGRTGTVSYTHLRAHET